MMKKNWKRVVAFILAMMMVVCSDGIMGTNSIWSMTAKAIQTHSGCSLQAESATKMYDGTPLTASTAIFSYDSFVASEVEALGVYVVCTMTPESTITDVGSVPNIIQDYTFYQADGTEYTGTNVFSTSISQGTLTVTPRTGVVVTITGNSAEVDYSGQEQSVSGYSVSISDPIGLYQESDFTFSGTALARGTDAGTYSMGLDASQFTNNNSNYADVAFQVIDGALVISEPKEKVNFTITTATATKVYDGAALTAAATAEGLLEGHTLNCTTTSLTNVGQVTNKVESWDIVDASGNSVKHLYAEPQVNEGYLQITPKSILVTVEGKWYYANYAEGESYFLSDDEASDNTFFMHSEYNDGSKYAFIVRWTEPLYTEADYEYVGDVSLTVTPEEAAQNGGNNDHILDIDKSMFVNKNSNFDVTFAIIQDPKLSIVKNSFPGGGDAILYIIAQDAVKEYDGTPLTCNGVYAVDDDGKEITGITATMTPESTITNVGSVENVIASYSGAPSYDGYKKMPGRLTITPRAGVVVTLRANSASVSYDGTQQTLSGYEVVNINDALYTAADFSCTGNDSVSGMAAGTYQMNLSAADFVNNNPNFKDVQFVVEDGGGVLEITDPRAVVVTIKGNNDTVQCDAQMHCVNGYEVVSISNSLYTTADFVCTAKAAATGYAAGTYYMGLTADSFTNLNENFDVTFVVEDGYLTIEGTTNQGGSDSTWVYIDAKSVTKMYDGTPLTAGIDYRVVGDNYTVTAVMDAASTITNVGTVANRVASYVVKDGKYTASGYNGVIVTEGTLTVTPRTGVVVTIKGNQITGEYDGSEKTASGYAVVSIKDANGKNYGYSEADFAFTGSEAVATGTDAGTYYMGLNSAQFVNKNRNFADVTFVVEDGYYKVEPSTEEILVTVKEKSGSFAYDGTAKTVTGYELVSISNADYKETNFKYTGAATVSGVDVGIYDMNVVSSGFENLNGNYSNVKFVVEDGQLEITPCTDPVTVTVTGNTRTNAYNRAEQSVSDYSISSNNALYDVAKVSFSGEAIAKGVDAGTYYMGLTADMFTNGDGNFTNVEFTVTDGKLQITPITDEIVVTVIENSDTCTYDGKTHYLSGFTVTGISHPLYKAEDVEYGCKDCWEMGLLHGGLRYGTNGKNAGTYEMPLYAGNFFNTNKNFTNVTFDFDANSGKLVIEPLRGVIVTVKERSGSYTYDGTEKSISGYTVSTNNSLYKNSTDYFTFGGNSTVKATDAGTYDMELKASDFTNVNTNFEDVQFVITDGQLKINPSDEKITVTITENSGTYIYNGKEQSVTGYTVSSSNSSYTEADFTFSGNATAKGTNAGTYDMELKASDFTNTNTSFSNVEFVIVDGQLTVNPVSEEVVVTITGNNGTFTYDGTPKSINGYTVSIDNDLYAEANIAFNGEAAARGTDAGTYEMNLSAGAFENISGNFSNVKFVIAEGSGQLEIKKVTGVVVTITENGASPVYNGTQQAVEGYTVDITDASGLYTKEDISFSGDASVKGTDAGTYEMNLTPADFTNNNPNFEVTFKVVDSSMTIQPITDEVVVTITENSDGVNYDGQLHSVTGYAVTSISNSLYTEADFNYSGEAVAEGTRAGTYEMEVDAAKFTNTNKNFTNVRFQVVDGYLVISPVDEVTVFIAEKNGTVEYNGKEQSLTGYTVTSISNDLYKESDFSLKDGVDATAKGTIPGSYDVQLKAEDFENTNTNFSKVNFVVTDGQLTIVPCTQQITVTITGNSQNATYDGTEKTVGGYTVDISAPTGLEGLYTEDGIDFDETKATVSGTDAGTYEMGITAGDFTNTNDYFSNVVFVIAEGSGQLVINPIDEVTVTIKGNSDSKVYNGKEQKVSGYTAEFSNSLYTADDFSFSGKAEATGRDADTYVMGLSASQFSNQSKNFKTVHFVVEDGQLKITPVTEEVVVTITGTSGTHTYDGTEKTIGGYTVSSSNDLYTEDHIQFNGEATAKGTNAGTYEMDWTEADFENISKNFENVKFVIAEGSGQLVIEKLTGVTVTITEKSDTVAYDGQEHSVADYTVSIDNPLYTDADFTFNGSATVSGTDAGKHDLLIKAEDFVNNNDNFEDVTFVIVDGYLTITPYADPITVTIKENGDSVTYDGTEHVVTGYEVTAISNALYDEQDFTFMGVAQVKGTDAGDYPMEVKAADFANISGNFSNVTFLVEDGVLSIAPIDDEIIVTITGESKRETYDGTEKTIGGYTVKSDNPLYKQEYVDFGGNATAAGTNAGTYSMGLKDNQFANTSKNFTNIKFVIAEGSGELVIDKVTGVTVTITENSDSLVYNGQVQQVEDYTVSISNNLYTDGDFIFKGVALAEGKNAGTYEMNVKAEDFENVNRNFDQVTFVVEDGALVITPVTDRVEVVISGATGEHIYDGTEKAINGYEITVNNPLYTKDDFTFSGDATAKGTNAGTYEMVISEEDFENISKNFTNVGFVVEDNSGKLVIEQIQDVKVVITENSGSFPYTGKEQRLEGYTVTSISNELYDLNCFKFNGTAVAIGTKAGTYDMNVVASDFENISDNFRNVTFEVVQGQMVIDPVDELTVFITENSGSYVYDGTEKTVTGYTISTNSKVDYSQDDFDFTGDAEVKGINAGTYEMELQAKDFANISENFSKVNFVIVDGMLTISPVTDEIIVTITGNGGEHTYDGTEKTIGGYTVSIDNPLYDEDSFTFTGEATAKGTDAGIYDMEILPEDFNNINDNFSNIKFVVAEGSGQMVITPVQGVIVTVRENGGTYTYDGSQKAVSGYTVANINHPLYKEADFSFNGSAVVAGVEVGTYSMDVKPQDFINHNTNFEVVNFVVEEGQLVINPVMKYSLTIRYVDTAGNVMAADYIAELEAGASFNVESPRINGYTPNYGSVNSSADGMPATDLIITVVYTADPAPVVPNPTPAPQEPEAAPQEPQVIPEEPAPMPVTAPVRPAPVPEVQDTVEEEQEVVESVDIQVVVDEEGNIKLVPIGENDTPLANMDLGGRKEVGDHYCNIASLLIMLAAMGILVAYTKRMKKMQAKVLGLKAKLDDRRQN